MVSYSRLNETFTDTCVYRIGDHAGFFAEINHMIIGMIYCLENEKRFVLNSTNGLYCNDVWLDFFEPFTIHADKTFQENYNEMYRGILNNSFYNKNLQIDVTQDLDKFYRKKIAGLSTLIWPFIKRKIIFLPQYQFKSQFISNDMIQAGHQIIKSIWRLNPITQKKSRKLNNQ
jgi:hypothetical protein